MIRSHNITNHEVAPEDQATLIVMDSPFHAEEFTVLTVNQNSDPVIARTKGFHVNPLTGAMFPTGVQIMVLIYDECAHPECAKRFDFSLN